MNTRARMSFDFPYLVAAADIKHSRRDSPRKNERLSRRRRGNATESRAECAIRNAEADVGETTRQLTPRRQNDVPEKWTRGFDYDTSARSLALAYFDYNLCDVD